jgi:hypothetical protein
LPLSCSLNAGKNTNKIKKNQKKKKKSQSSIPAISKSGRDILPEKNPLQTLCHFKKGKILPLFTKASTFSEAAAGRAESAITKATTRGAPVAKISETLSTTTTSRPLLLQKNPDERKKPNPSLVSSFTNQRSRIPFQFHSPTGGFQFLELEMRQSVQSFSLCAHRDHAANRKTPVSNWKY